MASLTTAAILIRSVNYKEYDRMITLFSPSVGKIDVLARGCRKPKSPLLNACELFATGEYVLYQSKDRYILTSATIHESFYALRLDYNVFTQGAYLLNLTEAAIQPNQPFPDLFRLLIKTLHPLAHEEEKKDSKTILSLFLFHYAQLLGYKPRLVHCVQCGTKVLPSSPLYFDVVAGGVLCQKCNQQKKCPSLSEEHYRWLIKALKVGPQNSEQMPKNPPFHLLKEYVEYRLEYPVKASRNLSL
ncbi:MAG: DNA repair protein RecO [Clostridiales bacterium]|nr:DNA repair protein RecO [Clostridiales bacterium]